MASLTSLVLQISFLSSLAPTSTRPCFANPAAIAPAASPRCHPRVWLWVRQAARQKARLARSPPLPSFRSSPLPGDFEIGTNKNFSTCKKPFAADSSAFFRDEANDLAARRVTPCRASSDSPSRTRVDRSRSNSVESWKPCACPRTMSRHFYETPTLPLRKTSHPSQFSWRCPRRQWLRQTCSKQPFATPTCNRTGRRHYFGIAEVWFSAGWWRFRSYTLLVHAG